MFNNGYNIIVILFTVTAVLIVLFFKNSIEGYDGYNYLVDFDLAGCKPHGPVIDVNEAVNNLESSLAQTTLNQSTDVPRSMDKCDMLNIDKNLGEQIRQKQPYFLNGKPVDYYDNAYYYDFRYPRRPIPVDFARDQNGYCTNNPLIYPCYVDYSRHDIK